MTDRRAHAFYAIVGLALVLGLSIAMDAKLSMSLSDGLWFEVVVLVVVAAFLMEPNFSSGSTTTSNTVASIFVALGADRDRHEHWWTALLVLGLVAFATGVTAYVLRAPGQSTSPSSARVARVLSQVSASFGSWRCVLLATLGLGLATFNDPFGAEWTVSLLVGGYCLLVSRLQPHRLIHLLRGTAPEAFGRVVAIYPPYEAVVAGPAEVGLTVGSFVRVVGEGCTAQGVVTAEVTHSGARAWRALVPQLLSVLPDGARRSDTDPLTVELDPDGGAFEEVRDELARAGVELVGALTEGSSIRSAVIELLPGRRVELGDVLWMRDPAGATLWQVADATLARTAWSGDARRSTQVHATQVGRWNDLTSSFDADLRSPRPVEVTFGGAPVGPESDVVPANALRVGYLPKSPYPVLIDLVQLSRTHGAILGTTGTGKTHLTFALIDGLSTLGVKVICLDLTGQYKVRFPASMTLTTLADVDAFLSSGATVATCTPATGTAITMANAVARRTYDWASSMPSLGPAAAGRCTIVLEEAQNFVPEAFVVDDWGLKAKAQDTSLVVMESRKFGVGFLIVSQRTAMVTKSSLSQCNTVFAFQAVDQTGLDYLEGLCGPTLVRGVPTLPHRTAIVMGSAVRSASPLIAYIDDVPQPVP